MANTIISKLLVQLFIAINGSVISCPTNFNYNLSNYMEELILLTHKSQHVTTSLEILELIHYRPIYIVQRLFLILLSQLCLLDCSSQWIRTITFFDACEFSLPLFNTPMFVSNLSLCDNIKSRHNYIDILGMTTMENFVASVLMVLNKLLGDWLGCLKML